MPRKRSKEAQLQFGEGASHSMNIRVSNVEHFLIHQAVELAGYKVLSAYIRDLVLADAWRLQQEKGNQDVNDD